MRTFKTFAVINVLAYIVMVGINFLANAVPINGQTTGEVSAGVPVLFEPANYAFSIWGLIYLLLAVWVIRAFFVTAAEKLVYTAIGYLFAVNALLNALWIVLFHYELFNLTILVMFGILYTLIRIYSIIEKSGQTSLLLRVPISIYMGWISVAAIVNVFIFFKSNEISSFLGLGELGWTMIMLIVTALLGAYMILVKNDLAYGLVLIWAVIAIAVNQMTAAPAVAKTAMVVWIFLAILTILKGSMLLLRKK
ncbi:tryptophan-rich sensory protein [Metabacillus sp. KIGAM252]|uniref:Tryptophan-rich sensory protein n=1 Tax=Metabacillus flavus TaxID=2823519 RepID=A0ABS5LCS3_9BACI|nr:tryptophan-rich sensory protein [Metabacillus flavus]MBS2968512.1 tryptophan-rich sensory protein [Metabacillus flavus]